MKVALSTLALVIGFAASVSCVQAQDSDKSATAKAQPAVASASQTANESKSATGFFPGGGWDGNNLRVSVSHSKLLKVSAQ
jgi:hypothetical protein